MATKEFCDECGKEVEKNVVSDRVELKVGKWTFEVVIAKDNTWNDGHLCFECLKKLINKCKYSKKEDTEYY